jgi:hypothetical protein
MSEEEIKNAYIIANDLHALIISRFSRAKTLFICMKSFVCIRTPSQYRIQTSQHDMHNNI